MSNLDAAFSSFGPENQESNSSFDQLELLKARLQQDGIPVDTMGQEFRGKQSYAVAFGPLDDISGIDVNEAVADAPVTSIETEPTRFKLRFEKGKELDEWMTNAFQSAA